MVHETKALPMNKVIVIAPHPDDETLGCGGTLLRHKAEGDEIHWLIITKMEENIVGEKKANERKSEIRQVFDRYQFKSLKEANFLATQLDAIPKKKIIDAISEFFKEIEPNIVYLPYIHDIHSDHQVIVDATMSCLKSFRYPYIKKVRSYETVSETEFTLKENTVFQPNLFMDITEFLDEKIEIMKLYSGEIKDPPFPRSEENLRALATLRGSTINVRYAEAFITLKEIL